MATDSHGDRKEDDRKRQLDAQGEWWDKEEFIRFLTRLAQGYPPKSRPRKFIEDYIDDLRENA